MFGEVEKAKRSNFGLFFVSHFKMDTRPKDMLYQKVLFNCTSSWLGIWYKGIEIVSWEVTNVQIAKLKFWGYLRFEWVNFEIDSSPCWGWNLVPVLLIDAITGCCSFCLFLFFSLGKLFHGRGIVRPRLKTFDLISLEIDSNVNVPIPIWLLTFMIPLGAKSKEGLSKGQEEAPCSAYHQQHSQFFGFRRKRREVSSTHDWGAFGRAVRPSLSLPSSILQPSRFTT